MSQTINTASVGEEGIGLKSNIKYKKNIVTNSVDFSSQKMMKENVFIHLKY